MGDGSRARYVPPTRPLAHKTDHSPTLTPASITSTNRFSALSLPTSPHTKKPLPRTPASGAGKHRAHEEPAVAQTKLQKKNAAQAAAKKAAKEAEEKERLERLARYRREQEK